MRRLYLQIHAALVATLVVSALFASLALFWLERDEPVRYSWEHLFLHWLLPVFVLTLVLAVAAYPVARRITRRLERLQSRVEALGRGELQARIDVEGSDEVADLARSFNRAAERIETLVGAQRRLLAGASHELRSPLARLRVLAAVRKRAILAARARAGIHQVGVAASDVVDVAGSAFIGVELFEDMAVVGEAADGWRRAVTMESS